ncbi:hypothetical protein D3C73_1654560 [compost metagenome]
MARAAPGIEDAPVDRIRPAPDALPVDLVHLPDIAEQLRVLGGTCGVSVSDAPVTP